MEWWSRGVVESWSRGVVESWSGGVVESWSRGVVESWSRGVVESWSRGVVEWWSDGVVESWSHDANWADGVIAGRMFFCFTRRAHAVNRMEVEKKMRRFSRPRVWKFSPQMTLIARI